VATLTAIFTAQDNLSKAMANAGNAGSKTSGVMQKLGKIGSVAMKGIITAVVAAGTALLAFGKKAVNVGMAYEASMSQVMATMGLDKSTEAGAKAYETLAAAAEHMGATTAFSTTEAADALNYLALAGYDAKKAAAALPTVLYLAGAGAMDLASASNMLTDAMSALQIEATQENLTEFSDKLAKTASSSNTSVAQLGEAVLAVGGTAANLKGGITELTASLGILADAGIKGSEAGTHLRNMINSLQQGRNSDATKLMKKMGFSAYDAAGNMRSLGDQFKDINAYMEGMSGAEVDSVIRTLFKQTDLAAARAMLAATANSVESLTSIVDSSLADSGKSLADYGIDLGELAKTFDPLATQEQFAAQMMQDFGLDAETAAMIFEGLNSVLNGTGTRFDELTEKIDDSAGACEQMYRTMLDNLQGDVDIFKSTVEALYIEIFKSTSDTLRNLVQTGTGYMQRLIEAFKAGGFSGLAKELGNVLGDAITVVMSYVPSLVSAGTNIIVSLVEGIGNNADTFTEAALDIAESLIGAIINIGPKLAGAIMNIFRAASQSLLRRIPKIFNKIPDRFYKALGLDPKKTKAAISNFTAKLQGAVRHLFDGDISGALGYVGQALGLDGTKIMQIKKRLGSVVNWTKTTFSGMKSAFGEGYAQGGLFGGIKGALDSLKGRLSELDWAGIWDGIKNTASEAYENLKFAAIDAKDKVIDWFKGIDWAGIWNKISSTATDLWNKMKLAAVLAWIRVKLWFQRIDWAGIWNRISETASDLWEKLKTAATDAKDKVVEWFQRIDWGGIWNKITSTATDLWIRMKAVAVLAWIRVKAWFKGIDWAGIWNKITDTASDLWEKMKTVASDAKDKVVEWFGTVDWNSIWKTVTATFIGLWKKLKTAASVAIALVKAWFLTIDWSGIWDGIKTTSSELWENLKSALESETGEGGVIGTLSSGLLSAMETAETIGTYVTDAITTLKDNGTIGTIWESVKSAAESIKNIVTECISALTGNVEGMESTEGSSNIIVAAFEAISIAVQAMSTGLEWLSKAIDALNDAGALKPILEGLGGAIATYFTASAIMNVANFFKAFAAGKTIFAALNPYILAITAGVGALIALLKWAENASANLNKTLHPDVELNYTLNTNFGIENDRLAQAAAMLVSDLNEKLVEYTQNGGDPVEIQQEFSVDAIFERFNGMGQGQKFVDAFEKYGVFDEIQNMMDSTFSGETVEVGVEPTIIENPADDLLSSMSETIQQATGQTVDFSNMFGGVNTAADQAASDALSTLNGIASEMETSGFETAGGEAAQGYTQGLQNEDTSGAASAVVTATEQAVRSAQASGSPAAAFMPIGAEAAQGYGMGLQQEDVSGYASTFAAAAIAAVAAATQSEAAALTLEAEGTNTIATFAAGMTAGSPVSIAVMTATGVAIRAVAQAVNLTAQGSNMLRTLTNGMNSGRAAAIASARTTGNGIRSAFASINLTSTGANIMRGLLNGMNSMFSSLLARARQMAAELKKTIQSGMEVHSPSRFTEWVGEMTGQGLINGIEGMADKAASAASNMVSGVSDAFTPNVSTPTPTAASASPYEGLAQNNNSDASGSSGERRIVIDVTGSGKIEVGGLSKEKAIELISQQIKPQLEAILSEEIFTGGEGTYEF